MRSEQLIQFAAFVSAVNAGAHVVLSPAPNNQVSSASSDIVQEALQTFCSSILGYTAPTTTITRTATSTPTDTYYDFEFVEITTSTVYYDAVSTVYTTNALAKRAAASDVPSCLSKYPASVITSACALVAPRSTVVVSTTTTAPAVTSTETRTITDYDIAYVPTATVTTTVGIDCGVKGAENRVLARPPAGNGNAADGSAGIENCTLAQGQQFVRIQNFYLDSWAIGVRPNGLTYCDFYMGSARQAISGAIVGEANFTYCDKACFPPSS